MAESKDIFMVYMNVNTSNEQYYTRPISARGSAHPPAGTLNKQENLFDSKKVPGIPIPDEKDTIARYGK